uniref:G-protein coupled receptors family 1 profile domain-containing protein n=1 Tax=Romanomermis culicivorax TaxID=13658 RepID=A0A915J884_ROMCU
MTNSGEDTVKLSLKAGSSMYIIKRRDVSDMVDLSFNDIYIIITIIWGLSTFATNFMLLIVIRRARKNAFTPGAPSPFYIHPLQYLLIIVDCAYGMAASFNALDVSRLWFYPQAYTALSCLISIYPKLFTTIASLFIQLLLNVERICSTAWPLQYRYQGAIGNRSKALYCSACFAPAFLYSLLGFVGVNYGAKPTSCNPTVISVTGYLYLSFPTERNETECNRPNVTERKENFRSVRLGWRLPSAVYRKAAAERFKLLIRSISSEK